MIAVALTVIAPIIIHLSKHLIHVMILRTGEGHEAIDGGASRILILSSHCQHLIMHKHQCHL